MQNYSTLKKAKAGVDKHIRQINTDEIVLMLSGWVNYNIDSITTAREGF
jgi:hypothetical protein